MNLLVIVFLLPYLLSEAGDPCPPKEELKSCICTQRAAERQSEINTPVASMVSLTPNVTAAPPSEISEAKVKSLYTVVDCNISRSIVSLEETVVFGLHRKLVDKLTIYNVPPVKEHTLARLPSGWLRNTRIKHFEILDSILSGDFLWYGNPFEGQSQSLIMLTVNRCFLYGALTYDAPGTVNTKGLDQLPYVELLDFSYNELVAITTSAFQRPPANLSIVVLSRNSIHSIDPSAFKVVHHLKDVDLSHNLLESIVRAVFAAPAKSLEKINLSWNFLKSLPPDFFTNMPALKWINLSKNFLFSMPDKPWSLVWRQLRFVDVDGNFINCDCNLLWLVASRNLTTPAVAEQPSRVVRGKCVFHRLRSSLGVEYELKTLTHSQLMCAT